MRPTADYPHALMTTDGTLTTLETIPIQDNTCFTVQAHVTALATDGNAARYQLTAIVKRWNGGVATLVGTVESQLNKEDVAGWDCTIDVTGNNARIRVQGDAGRTVYWVRGAGLALA